MHVLPFLDRDHGIEDHIEVLETRDVHRAGAVGLPLDAGQRRFELFRLGRQELHGHLVILRRSDREARDIHRRRLVEHVVGQPGVGLGIEAKRVIQLAQRVGIVLTFDGVVRELDGNPLPGRQQRDDLDAVRNLDAGRDRRLNPMVAAQHRVFVDQRRRGQAAVLAKIVHQTLELRRLHVAGVLLKQLQPAQFLGDGPRLEPSADTSLRRALVETGV